MLRTLLIITFTLITSVAGAQYATQHSDAVKTPQMMLNDEWSLPPVIEMGSDDVIHFSFDEMSHVYHRYICRIIHCNADGTPSELHEIDYLDGFNDFVIENWENSHNTTVLYTHYTFDIPNENVNLKLSGNYRVDIIDDDSEDDNPVLTFEFSVVEKMVSIEAEISGDTDRSYNEGEQQLSFAVNHKLCNIASPANEIIPVVYQNRRRDNKVVGLAPAYMTAGRTEYVHNTNLIFEAGNEYRRFELTDPDSPGMNVEDVIYHDSSYHALLYIDKQRLSYTNELDENGRFYINTTEGYGLPIEADYVNVHFAIDMPPRLDGNYYLLGDFCDNTFSERNRLAYDAEGGYYFASSLLKLGVYNYQYVWVPSGRTKALLSPTEGSFYNTDNEYLIYIYYREFGARYDRLVGFQVVDSSI
jgi:hypothetical protein